MDAALELSIERIHYRPVLRDAALTGKGCRSDANPEMGFAFGARTGVTPVAGGLVDNFKMAWGEFGRKFCNNRIANRHMFTPLERQASLPAILNS